MPTGGSSRAADHATDTSPLAGHSLLVRLPRRITWPGGRPGRERAITFGAFAVGPTIIYWVWFLAAARHSMSHAYRGLEWAMPLAAIWITFGPLLMLEWEYSFERLSRTLIASRSEDRWNLAAMPSRVPRRPALHAVRSAHDNRRPSGPVDRLPLLPS